MRLLIQRVILLSVSVLLSSLAAPFLVKGQVCRTACSKDLFLSSVKVLEGQGSVEGELELQGKIELNDATSFNFQGEVSQAQLIKRLPIVNGLRVHMRVSLTEIDDNSANDQGSGRVVIVLSCSSPSERTIIVPLSTGGRVQIQITANEEWAPFGFASLRSARGDACIEVPSSAMGVAPLQRNRCTAERNQRWKFAGLACPYFQIRSEHAGLCLRGTGENSGTASQGECNSEYPTKWRFQALNNGNIRIRQATTGSCLTVTNSNTLVKTGPCTGLNSEWSLRSP
jgi:hypothetical protein